MNNIIEKNIIALGALDYYDYLTNFEKTQILSFRSKQLDLGATSTLSKKILLQYLKQDLNTYDIAKLELKFKKLPLKLKRVLPNGESYLIDVNQLTSD